MELYEFTFVGCSVFSAGVYGVELKQLTNIRYAICYVVCYCAL